MDRNRFDALAKLLATTGSRRATLGAVFAFGILGDLSDVLARPGKGNGKTRRKKKQQQDRQHKQQRRRKRRRNDRKDDKPPGLGAGEPCASASDCADQECQTKSCSQGQCAYQPVNDAPSPNSLCSSICCSGNCCPADATTCNALGLCCVPNCDNRQCGPDGCGSRNGCGTCPSGSTCDEDNGTCLCSAATCSGGCCDGQGRCRPGDNDGACGTDGETCKECTPEEECQDGQCVTIVCAGTCSNDDECPNFRNCVCNEAQGACCTRNCRGKVCGSDGCGDTCGNGCEDGQVCSADGSACLCTVESCPNGCCSNGPGNPGACHTSAQGTCGLNGAQCQECTPGTICNSGGNCICTPSTCPGGCCDTVSGSVTCFAPPTADHCGIDGVSCVACPPVGTCLIPICNETGGCDAQEANDQQTPGCDGPGQLCCSGFCRNLQTDPNNCGFCENPCRENETCASGQCICQHVTCGLEVCCPYGETCSPLNTCPCRTGDDCPNDLQCCGASEGVDGTCTECCNPGQCAETQICEFGECQECISLNGTCSPSVCERNPPFNCCCDVALGAACAEIPDSGGVFQCFVACQNNDECPGGAICAPNGFCLNECTQDSECPPGQFCNASDLGTGVCGQVICTANNQCPAGQSCQGGVCVYATT